MLISVASLNEQSVEFVYKFPKLRKQQICNALLTQWL